MTQTALPDAVAVPAPPLDYQALAGEVVKAMRAPVQTSFQRAEEALIRRSGPANTLNIGDVSQQTIDLARQAMQGDINRAGVNVATGYVGYDLKAPAATLVPYMTPLLNMTPRIDGVGIDTHHWKAITDFFNGGGPQSVIGAVADGGTPTFVQRNVISMQNTFQTIGLQDSLTFQAQWRGRQLEGDLRALLTSQLLYALKLVEENWLINMSDRLWTPPPMLISATNSGGTITNATNGTMWFRVTAVSANGETLGTSLQSVTIPGTTSSITLTIFTVPNAVKYNIYAAQNTGAVPADGATWLQSAATQFGNANALNQPSNPIQGSFTATMTAPPATSGTAYSAVTAAGNTAIVAANAGNPITWQGAQALIYNNTAAPVGTGAGGLKAQIIQPAATTGFLALSDIQNLLLNMYNNARANPEYLFISPQDGLTLNNLVAANGQTRVVVDGSTPDGGQASLTAGFKVSKFLNQVTQSLMSVIQLPFLPQGTMIAGSFSFPYPVAGFANNPFYIITNQEYYGVEYPPTPATPTSWGMGDYVDSTVVNEFLGGWGIINGIVYH
jgi:hypothetical protein